MHSNGVPTARVFPLRLTDVNTLSPKELCAPLVLHNSFKLQLLKSTKINQ